MIDLAQTDYQAGTIAKTEAAYTAILDLKAIQATGVQALETYDALLQAKASSSLFPPSRPWCRLRWISCRRW